MVEHNNKLKTLMIKIQHDAFQFALRHLSIAISIRASGINAASSLRHFVHAFNFIVQKKHLATPFNLTQASFPDCAFQPFANKGFDA